MGLFDYFFKSGAGVTQDIQSITRTGTVAPPPSTTVHRTSTTAPSVSRGTIGSRVLQTLGAARERITTGFRVGRGEQVDISRISPTKEVTPFSKYVTAPIYQTATKLSADYQRWMSGQKGIVAVPKGAPGAVIEPLRRFGTGVVRTPGILMETAGMVPLGAEYIAREPYQAAVGVPVGVGVMAGGLETGIRERPYETAGELAGMALGPKVIGKVSPIKPVVVKVPVKPTLRSPYLPKVPTETITYRGLYAQLPLTKPKPLVGAVGVKPYVGAPRIEVARGYMPITKVETAVVLPSIKSRMSPTEAVRLETGIKLMEQLAKEKPQAKVPLDISEVKYVPKRAQATVEQWLQSRDSVIYGSATQKVQMMKGRIPKDIDVAVKNPAKAAIELEAQLKTILGENVRRRGTTIEVYEKGSWHHAVDIHPMEHIKGLLEYGFETQPPIKIVGQQYMAIGEQFTRKGRSILTPRERTVDPVAHRMKDILDFVNIAQSLIESKRASAGSSLLFKRRKMGAVVEAERLLTKFKETRGTPSTPSKPLISPPKKTGAPPKVPRAKRPLPTIPKEIIGKPTKPIELVPPTREYPRYTPTKKPPLAYPPTLKTKPSSVEVYPVAERYPISDTYPSHPVSGTYPLIPKAGVETPYIPTYPRKPDDQYLAAVVSPPYTPPTTPPYKPVIAPPYTPTVTPPYTPPTYPPYTPPTYPPTVYPPYPPPEAPVYHIPPSTPPPMTRLPLKPKEAKPKKKIGYHDPRYWPIQNPVSDLWGMLGIKRK